jgi:hypothetical protein
MINQNPEQISRDAIDKKLVNASSCQLSVIYSGKARAEQLKSRVF